jgi:hypothetical protein
MRPFLLTLAIVLLASPVLAQEIDLGLGGDVGGLLNLPAPTGRGTPAPGARGAAPAAAGARGAAAPPRGAAPNAPPLDRLVRLRELLTASSAPLSPQQETGLNALLNAEIPVMRQTLQKRILEMQRARGGPGPGPAAAAAAASPPPPTATIPPPSVPSGAAAGSRGMPPNANPNLPSMDELAPEIIRLNDQLLGKIADAPLLTPPQQTLIKKLYKDQVKSRGGFDAIKLTMEDAGAAFSPEQIAQIQPLFDEQNEARARLVRENPGQPPDKAKLDQLQRDTLSRVLKLLTAPQRLALLAPAPKAP